MDKIILNITVRDKVATYDSGQPPITCDNDDYRIRFDFDEKWNSYAKKVAHFVSNGEFIDKEFNGNEVDVPVQVNTVKLEVGVYIDGVIRTTTSAAIPCRLSALSNAATPSLENDGRYLNEAKEVLKECENIRDSLDVDFENSISETANAIKATASGKKVTLDDISPITHTLNVQLKSETITDFSGLTLKRYGATESEFLETYTANADGTVNGVTSLYPTMTLEAPEAATVEVEYNRDLQSALDSKLDMPETTKIGVPIYNGIAKKIEGVRAAAVSATGTTIAERDSKGRLHVKTSSGEDAKEVAVNNHQLQLRLGYSYLNFFTREGQEYKYTPYNAAGFGWMATTSAGKWGVIYGFPTNSSVYWGFRLANGSNHEQTVELHDCFVFDEYSNINQVVTCFTDKAQFDHSQWIGESDADSYEILNITLAPHSSVWVQGRMYTSGSSGRKVSQIGIL